MVRKSKLIGETIGDFVVLDSIHIKNDTRLKVKCLKCGLVQEKCRKSIIKKICQCEKCGNGKKKRNANGHYNTDLYNRYMIILRRTKGNDENHKKYYLDKNIKMCDEWQNDFMKFYEWSINNGYKKGLTIDRIDNSKGYNPKNCRWVTSKEQANNRSSNTLINCKGETLTLTQLAEKYNLPRYIVYNRHRAKWSIEDIINKPIDVTKRSKNYGK